jgi:hypothetical protein
LIVPKDGADKEQAFHSDFTKTFSNSHVPPRDPCGV